MDKDTIVYPHIYTWEQFQRALLYTKKYYGMDAPYFYQTVDAELAGRGQSITIHNRLMCEDFCKRLLFVDKSVSKYMEQIPDEEIAVIWTLMFVEWGLWCEWLKNRDNDYALGDYYADNPNAYYQDHMREELLKTYLFCKQTPIRPHRTNEIILTINKGYKDTQKHFPCRISRIGYCGVHYCTTAKAIWKTYIRRRRHKRHWMLVMKKGAGLTKRLTASYTGLIRCSRMRPKTHERPARDCAASFRITSYILV